MSSPRNLYPPSPSAVTPSAAVNNASTFIARHGLAADLTCAAWPLAARPLERAAEDLGVMTSSELHGTAARLLARATGIENISQFQPGPTAVDLHRARNTLAALMSGTLQSQGIEPDPALASLPSLRPRPGGPSRPLDDTEILLMRLWAVAQSGLSHRQTTNAFRYAMVECGAYPSEVPRLTPQDFDNLAGPSMVRLPGVYGVADARTAPVAEWARPIVNLTLTGHRSRRRSANQPLAYTARKPHASHYSAGASIARILSRAYLQAGIDGVTPEPLSALRWRIAHTMATCGLEAAAALLGKSEKDPRVHHFIRQPVPDDFETRGGHPTNTYEMRDAA